MVFGHPKFPSLNCLTSFVFRAYNWMWNSYMTIVKAYTELTLPISRRLGERGRSHIMRRTKMVPFIMMHYKLVSYMLFQRNILCKLCMLYLKGIAGDIYYHHKVSLWNKKNPGPVYVCFARSSILVNHRCNISIDDHCHDFICT